MIAYFDTSALVKLLIDEAGSEIAEQAWFAADVRVCCSIGITEAAAAIARAWRSRRIDEAMTRVLLDDLAEQWRSVARVRPDDELTAHAAELAVLFGLRGYDAVHLAAAIAVNGMFVAADRDLLDAAGRSALDIVDLGA